MNTQLYEKTASELSSLLAEKKVSAVEVTQSFIDRTNSVEEKVGAYLHLSPDYSLSLARESDQRREKSQTLGPLDGIPISIKDILCEVNQPLTAASKILEDYISPYTSTVVQKLLNKGSVSWGRLNLDEFAMGSSTENSAFKTTRNPWDLRCIPGGSSGGSAACIAAGQSPLSLGSDTGGSIRQPAALCGVVGMKPTYGLVSRYGLAAFASSLDQIGPFARTIEDIALLMQVIVGHDPLDSTSVDITIPDYRESLKDSKKDWVLGVPKEFFTDGMDPEVRIAVEKAIDFYREEGAIIKEISLPHTDLAVPVYYIIATAEASSNLARYDGIRYTKRVQETKDGIDLYSKTRGEFFGSEVKRRILLGAYVLSSGYYDAYYLKAQKVRNLIRQDFNNAFEAVDALITPTTPEVAFKAGEKSTDPLSMYLSDIYTISTNLAGLPAISIPCGFNSENLPIGLQLIGKPFQESTIMNIGLQFEKKHSFTNLANL